MRGFIHEVDDKHDQYVHVADKRDIDALAKHCGDLRSVGAGNGKEWKHCMSADSFTIQKWCDIRGVTWREFHNNSELRDRFIDDPDNRAFRIWEGKL